MDSLFNPLFSSLSTCWVEEQGCFLLDSDPFVIWRRKRAKLCETPYTRILHEVANGCQLFLVSQDGTYLNILHVLTAYIRRA